MLIDCDTCVVRGDACGDCVVSVMLGAPPEGVELDDADRRALDALADGGLVPRLRVVPLPMPTTRPVQPGAPRRRRAG
ncbi:MAG TPA: hypothetical protein VGR21_12425 [Cryptosporangiaceae bacterium]|nr:hypothetical protein [Cryptosporangiaceae bacterium]